VADQRLLYELVAGSELGVADELAVETARCRHRVVLTVLELRQGSVTDLAFGKTRVEDLADLGGEVLAEVLFTEDVGRRSIVVVIVSGRAGRSIVAATDQQQKDETHYSVGSPLPVGVG